ncbi:MAG TPA: glycosyltransferase [Acidobacteriaceae bacterium]|nr:glycosyltransferase [Acidobacteriaceae bacterium]
MNAPPALASADRSAQARVAFFPDSFHEVNGVAHTSRHFVDFARRRKLPFLCVRAGDRRKALESEAALTTLELPRGWLSFPLDRDLKLDPAWIRHIPAVARTLRAFAPDVIHITGPSEIGVVGALMAEWLRIPLAASWHTNLHEYAVTRSHWLLEHLPPREAASGGRLIERTALAVATVLYKRSRVLFAPNPDLCQLLERETGTLCHLMQRGVDTQAFSPEYRQRSASESDFILGFVGRLSVEKNVALLARVQRELEALGIRNFRFRIVGQGAEESRLREHLPRAEFTGVLRGEALARAYAGMDVFVFPSHTDTFGNVVLEALASGVPVVVTPDGGPRSLVQEGRNGCIARDEDFAAAIARLLLDDDLRQTMRGAARTFALTASWDSVFEKVYAAYEPLLAPCAATPAAGWRRPTLKSRAQI